MSRWLGLYCRSWLYPTCLVAKLHLFPGHLPGPAIHTANCIILSPLPSLWYPTLELHPYFFWLYVLACCRTQLRLSTPLAALLALFEKAGWDSGVCFLVRHTLKRGMEAKLQPGGWKLNHRLSTLLA